MTETTKRHDTRQRLLALVFKARSWSMQRPLAAAAMVLATGLLLVAGGRSAAGLAEVEAIRQADAGRQAHLMRSPRRPLEINALAGRGELQPRPTA